MELLCPSLPMVHTVQANPSGQLRPQSCRLEHSLISCVADGQVPTHQRARMTDL